MYATTTTWSVNKIVDGSSRSPISFEELKQFIFAWFLRSQQLVLLKPPHFPQQLYSVVVRENKRV